MGRYDMLIDREPETQGTKEPDISKGLTNNHILGILGADQEFKGTPERVRMLTSKERQGLWNLVAFMDQKELATNELFKQLDLTKAKRDNITL